MTRRRRNAPETHTTAYRDLVLARRAFREMKGYRLRVVAIFLVDLLATPLFLLAPVPVAIAIDSVVGTQKVPPPLDSLSQPQLLIVAAALQVVVVLLANLQVAASQVLSIATSERLTVSFRSRLFGHVQRLSFSFHDQRGTTDSLFRIQYDTPALGGMAIGAAIPILAAAVTLVAVFVVIFRLNVELALIALAVSPFLVLLSVRFKWRIRNQYREAKQLDSSAMGIVQEVLSTFRVVKAFGREEAEHARYLESADRSVDAKVRIAWTESLLGLLLEVVTAFGTGAVLYVGVRNVQSGTLSVGALLVILNYLTRLYEPLRTIARKFGDVQDSLVSAQRGFEILDYEPEITDKPNAWVLHKAVGAFEFRDVGFCYDGTHPVLRDVTFSVAGGTSLGIVGRTGAGKSTLVSLLMRFYDPTLGTILLDGVDLRDYRVADLRSQFALVLQEPVLFSTSIRENIAYGRPDASFRDIQAAAVAAGAHRFILDLPDRYESVVGERGMRLSGGERQRISLARAFLKDAPVLILDEPTSSVDIATERAIMRAMVELMEGRTSFMIAHRLSTLERCDAILEVGGGSAHLRSYSDPTDIRATPTELLAPGSA